MTLFYTWKHWQTWQWLIFKELTLNAGAISVQSHCMFLHMSDMPKWEQLCGKEQNGSIWPDAVSRSQSAACRAHFWIFQKLPFSELSFPTQRVTFCTGCVADNDKTAFWAGDDGTRVQILETRRRRKACSAVWEGRQEREARHQPFGSVKEKHWVGSFSMLQGKKAC